MKKLVMVLLLAMSIQMCAPDVKLDYNVTKSESYKISKGKLEKNSIAVKEGFEADQKKLKDRVKEIANNLISKKLNEINEDAVPTNILKQLTVRMVEKSFENQTSKIEEIKFFNEDEAQIRVKAKAFDNSKSSLSAIANDTSKLGEIIAKKMNFKSTNEMFESLDKMENNEGVKKFFDTLGLIIEDEFKKPENYTEISANVNMKKINGKWQIPNIDNEIKNAEFLLNNVVSAM